MLCSFIFEDPLWTLYISCVIICYPGQQTLFLFYLCAFTHEITGIVGYLIDWVLRIISYFTEKCYISIYLSYSSLQNNKNFARKCVVCECYKFILYPSVKIRLCIKALYVSLKFEWISICMNISLTICINIRTRHIIYPVTPCGQSRGSDRFSLSLLRFFYLIRQAWLSETTYFDETVPMPSIHSDWIHD